MSDQPFWGFGGNGLAVLEGMRPKPGDLRRFLPRVETQGCQISYSAGVFGEVELRKIGSGKHLISIRARKVVLYISLNSSLLITSNATCNITAATRPIPKLIPNNP